MLNSDSDIATDPVDSQWYADIIQDSLVFWQYYEISHVGFLSSDTREYLEDLDELYQTYTTPITG